jgi:hypothetical protein
MPPGFVSLAANRANAADSIRGRGTLRTLPASAQTAGTAVSLLPPQNVAGGNLSLSLQASMDRAQTALAFAPLQSSIDRFQSSLAVMRTQTEENIGRFQLEGISEGQQLILNNLRRKTCTCCACGCHSCISERRYWRHGRTISPLDTRKRSSSSRKLYREGGE